MRTAKSVGPTRNQGRRSGPGRYRLRPEVVGLESRQLLSTAGALDTTFGTNGVRTIDFQVPQGSNAPNQTAFDVAIDPGKGIILAGYAASAQPQEVGVSGTIGRLTSNGSPDTSFGTAGQITINSGGFQNNYSEPTDEFTGIVRGAGGSIVDPTGAMILVGYDIQSVSQDQEEPPSSFALVRMSSSGGRFSTFPDPFFGPSSSNAPYNPDSGYEGIDTITFSPLSSSDYGDQASAALLQPDGKILVTGSTGASSTAIPLARVNDLVTSGGTTSLDPNEGALDSTFAPNGSQPGTELLSIPGVDYVSGISAMAFQGSNKIILAGTAFVGGQEEILLVRLNADSTTDAGDDAIDTSFGNEGDGVTLLPVPSGTEVSGLAVDASGRIVVGGSGTLAVFNANGTPNTAFGTSGNGLVTVPGMTINAVAIQSDGKIVLAGSEPSPAHSTFPIAALARYTASGVPDTGFGTAGTGLVTTDLGGAGYSAFDAVTTQTDGKIVAAGSFGIPNSSPSPPVTAVVRFIGLTPQIAGLSPSGVNPGASAFTLTVNGQNFTNGSVVDWNGAALTTTFVSGTTLTAAVPASDVVQAGTASITVNNPGSLTSNSAAFAIGDGKLTPTLDVRGVSAVYDSNPHPASFSIADSNGDNLSGLVTLTYNGSAVPPVHPGTYAVTAYFPGNSADNPVSVSAQVVIAQAVPGINWAPPAPISPGTPLSASQLDAFASVPGSFAYSPPAGTVLAAGTGQLLSVTFTPIDSVDYRSVTATVAIDVGSGPPQATGASFGPSTKRQSTIVVSFDQAMDPGSAGSAGLYTVRGGVKKKRHLVYSKRVGIRSVVYDAATHAVTITLSKRYKGTLQVTVGAGLRSADGGTTTAPLVLLT